MLGGVSAVHAGGDRKLAASGGAYDHYANAEGIPNFQPPVNGEKQPSKWADPVNLLWASGDKHLDGSTPAPSASFGPQTCRGYFQSPIDVPRKAVFHSARLNRSPDNLVTTEGAERGRKGLKPEHSISGSYTFPGTQITNLRRSVATPTTEQATAGAKNKARLYVLMIMPTGGNTDHQLVLGPTTGVITAGKTTPQYPCTAGTLTCTAGADPVVVYQPLQFHWHFPSEHTIDGIGYPGELHIVHSRQRWYRDATTMYINDGAGMFRSSTARTNKADACSGATGSNACTAGQTCGGSTAAALEAVTNELAAHTARSALPTATKDVLGEDNKPKDTAICSAAATEKYMPYLVLGFMLTEDCNLRTNEAHDWDNRDKHDWYNAPVGCRSEPNDDLVKAPLYNPSFMGSSDNTVTNNDVGLFDWNAADSLYTGAGAKFSYEANFGEAMKGPYFRYQGSLTTPPCTEGVEWVLFERALKLTSGTISKYMNNEADLGLSEEGSHGSSTFEPAMSALTKNADIADLIKATPLQIRNNRPTVAIHGRDVLYSKLTAVTTNKANGAKYNYKKPDQMWAATLDAAVGGTAVDRRSQCQWGVQYPDTNFQAPINFVGGEVYRGVTPVNKSWLKENTYGYMGANVGSAARWMLKNTGHGFNVIPRFSFNGQSPFVKNADPNQPNAANSAFQESQGHFMDHRRQLAGYGGNTIPPGYYVKKMNAAATAIEWYPMIQFHFHFPSEHTVDGYQYAGEMHLVHHQGLASSVPGTHVTELQYNVTQYSGGPMLKDSARRMQVNEEKVNGKDAMVLDLTGVQTRQLAATGSSTSSMSSSGSVSKEFQSVSIYGTKANTGHSYTDGETDPADGGAKDSPAGWANAVVLGFFLEEDDVYVTNSGEKSIMGLFGFNQATGVPFAQGDYWNMDVDSKKFASALFGDLSTKGWEVDGNGAAVASQLSTATHERDAYQKAPYQRNYFNYMGGLTTPPCWEGVQFIIFTDPLKIKTSEAKLFRQNFFMNNRPTQPRGKRVVLFNDMANAAQPLMGANMMTKVNPFKAPEKESQQTTFLVQSASSTSSGATSTALNMFAAAAASVFALVLSM